MQEGFSKTTQLFLVNRQVRAGIKNSVAWNIKLNGAFRPVRSAYKPPPIHCLGLHSIMQVKQSSWWRTQNYLTIINKRALNNISTLRILINFQFCLAELGGFNYALPREKYFLKEGKLKGIVKHGYNTKPDWDSFYHRRCWQRLILFKGLLETGCQQNSHGTEKSCKYLLRSCSYHYYFNGNAESTK